MISASQINRSSCTDLSIELCKQKKKKEKKRSEEMGGEVKGILFGNKSKSRSGKMDLLDGHLSRSCHSSQKGMRDGGEEPIHHSCDSSFLSST